MDRGSRSPETESRERAVSSEPATIRPNPFEDGDESSRKRRRTSLNADSRSRSVETESPPTAQGVDAASDPSSTSATTANTSVAAQDDSVMNIDTSKTSTPRTPENAHTTALQDEEHPPAATPAHVTLSLRNSARRTLETIPSSPSGSSAISQSPTPALPGRPLDRDNVKVSVEPSDVQTMTPPLDAAAGGDPAALHGTDAAGAGNRESSPASQTDTASPPVEVVGMQPEDEDAEFEPTQPQVTLLSGDEEAIPGAVLADPTTSFPYQNSVETPSEIMTKLLNYIAADIHVPQHLRDWIDNYLVFAKNSPFEVVYESHQQYRPLWIALPDLIWGVPSLRSPSFGTTDRAMREKLLDFCDAFARLTAYFVEFDYTLLQRLRSADDVRPGDFISSTYLLALASITRREPLQKAEDQERVLGVVERDEISEILDQFLSSHRVAPCGILLVLDRLLQSQIALMPSAPKIIDNFSHICVMAASLVREAYKRLAGIGLRPQIVHALKSRVALGHTMFINASAALSTAIENHITSLSYENASHQIAALGDLIFLSLKVDHPEAVRLAADFQEKHPDIPAACVPDAFAMEWRFSMFCRLIKCSQMQLRVMAVTSLCQELVACWRRYGEQAPEPLRETPVLQFVSDFLVSTGVVSYLLGPTCHPEIIAESGNIIGFLAVTRTYTNAHTDLFWQTVIETQDPRISEALIRTTCRIVNLFSYDVALYLCQKFLVVPITAFTSPMREFCDAVFHHICNKGPQEGLQPDTVPFAVCLRLLRESSMPGVKSPTAHPDVQSFAIEKLGDLLRNVGIEADQRQGLYRSCLADLKQMSATTLGSLCAINIINRHYGGRDLSVLTAEHNLTQLVVDELEDAIRASREFAFPAVLSGTTNSPRRDMIFQILFTQPYTLTPELSSRLWNMMTGPTSACKEDRNASWKILIACAKRTRNENNPFLTMCLGEFLPTLPPDCFCEGLLEFLRERLTPLLNDVTCVLLDIEDGNERKAVTGPETSVDRVALDQLWRIVLTAPPNTIERQAIGFLVKEVYIDSQSIKAFPTYRARKIHLALVNKCLQQLSSAASKLKAYATDASISSPDSGGNESLVVVGSEALIREQELLFIRSLQVLQEFHQLYRNSSQFSTPDLRSFILERSSGIEGESAELKYQSFDGDSQTEVMPLNIGRRNTAASLLASLKEATGFDNYRIYYRGQAFVPQESDICRSLEDLRIQNGLILVKRDVDPEEASTPTRPGMSPVEAEILGHFDELWEYMSMEEGLSREIYEFLSQLTVDEQFLKQFEEEDLAYTDVFSIGRPYKSLYALHALQEFLTSYHRPTNAVGTVGMAEPTDASQRYTAALATATKLIVAAICDPEITRVPTSIDVQTDLCAKLIQLLDVVLNVSPQESLHRESFGATLLRRLMEILSTAVDEKPTDASTRLVTLAFGAIMDSCAASRLFWTAFKQHEGAAVLIQRLLLCDDRFAVRQLAENQIGDKVVLGRGPAAVDASEFREFFWPIILGIIPKAIYEPIKCEAIFNLADSIMVKMLEAKPPTLDIPELLGQTSNLLLSYTTSEDITQTECADYAVFGLLRMFDSIYRASQSLELQSVLPVDFANKLFWKHLFPPWQSASDEEAETDDPTQEPYPRIIIHSQTRALLMSIIFELVDDDISRLPGMIRNLDQLVPCEKSDDDDPYHYELPQLFDRSKALRAPSGYVGLRNLSNTCYFNSLFTQLFMNVEFRRFMMNVEIRDEGNTQNLLFQTRVLFGFLQDSIRRYLDTQQCVASVKTYDDTPIDIHNQMDVDEFYNLLFDRWESQLLSAEDKQEFRAFYGGQLVQQVRSKECEHVSEKLDPFSAIQCDIKGKESLQESLQAYVDGEIMEGENKYKCSTCDRHVDAVKRACLKDIPDNLIFHLKRFDFNLRTLQRSKINDYFSFPHKIDMRPYTIDQLSNPSEEQSADIFELVGVLVHSGTAESGHYYSYIRERPSSKTQESWVEFNDDMVSAWDPSQMEALCFGGPDYRSNNNFSGDGGNGLTVDKSFSAYMLFYQRSSSLAEEQDAMVHAKISSPVRAEMPTALADHIRSENTSLVRRHALFDPQHLPFVSKMLGQVQFVNSGGHCTKPHKLENLAIQMALSHLDQVASRTKELSDFRTLYGGLLTMCNKCPRCYLAVFNYFDERPDVVRQMIQRCPESEVRIETGAILIQALQSLKKAYPEQYGSSADESDADNDGEDYEKSNVVDQMELDRSSKILHSAAYMIRILWDHFHLILRSWPETFGFMLAFVNLGREELAIFLDLDGFRRAILTISADSSIAMEPQFNRMLAAVQRRLPNRPPSYENVIALIDAMLAGMYPDRPTPRSMEEMFVEDNVGRYSLAVQSADGDLPMSRTEFILLGRDWVRDFGNVFVDKLIGINQNVIATDSIIARLMVTHPTMEAKIFTTLKANISSSSSANYQEPFLRVAMIFLRNVKSAELSFQMIKHISEQCRGLANTEGRAFFETLRDLFYGSTAITGQFSLPELLQGLRFLPLWVPGLLGYYDTTVSNDVEIFLRDHLFHFGTAPQFDENHGGAERATALIAAAKRLGVECLRYIQFYIIQRNMHVSSSIVATFQRVIEECQPYYLSNEDGSRDALSVEFDRLNSTIPQLVKRLIVEDIEEDGSDWNSSRCSSEPGDSLGDVSMQTAGELNDVDIP